MDAVSGGGAYDTTKCHEALRTKGNKPLIIPPRKNAGYWEQGHPRIEAVDALKNDTLTKWQTDSGSHDCSISKTSLSRYKGLTSGTLSLRCYNAQVGEALANVKAMNKVLGLGMPIRN
ncbi:hypothetical protein VcTj87_24660 [Vibrio comitans]